VVKGKQLLNIDTMELLSHIEVAQLLITPCGYRLWMLHISSVL